MAGDSCGLVEPNDLQKDSIEGTAILGLGTTYIANTYSSLTYSCMQSLITYSKYCTHTENSLINDHELPIAFLLLSFGNAINLLLFVYNSANRYSEYSISVAI